MWEQRSDNIEQMKKQHPIAILKYISKNFWLLLIPLVRGLFALKFDFYSWISGAYLDILVILLILGLAIFRWWNICYEIQDNGILFRRGLIVNEEFFIPYKSMSSVTAKRAMLCRPFKAVIISIETDSIQGMEKQSEADINIIVKLIDYKLIYNKIPINKAKSTLTYRAQRTQLLLYSFVFSSSLSGLIYFGTFLIQSGRLVSSELEKIFLGAVNDVTNFMGMVIEGLTPATVSIIIIIGIGWLISFVTNYLHTLSFRVQRCGKSIFIKSGFFSKWKYYINTERINYADIRQNLLMKICRVMSVQVCCTGYGKSKNESPVFVPITRKKSVMGVMKLLLPEYEPKEITVSPRWNYIMRFMGPPAVLIFAIIFLAAAMVMMFPQWYSVIFFAAIMCEIWSVQLLLVKFVAYYTNGVGFEDGILCLNYCRFYQFHKVVLPAENITSVEIRQTIFQRMNRSCDFVICTRGEKTKYHRVRGLNLEEAERAAAMLGYSADTI